MSIYATLWTIQVEDEDAGGSFEDAWIEVYAQGVPNHINEQNGYGGPGWDEWLPAFVHQPGCQQRQTVYHDKPAEDAGVDWIRQSASPDDPKAERGVYHDCACGLRAVFILTHDALTKKGTKRNSQEYVNPLLVLTGAEYQASTWEDMLQRIMEALSERRPRLLRLVRRKRGRKE